VFASSVALVACGQSNAAGGAGQGSDAGQAVREKYDDLHDLALEKRAEIERAIEQQLDSAREALADVSREATKQGQVQRAKLAEELQRDQAAAEAKLDALRNASAEEWQRLCRESQTESRRLADQAKALFQDG
jgi:hypothetical protein